MNILKKYPSLIYAFLGSVFWLAVMVCILQGYTTPTEAFALATCFSFLILYKSNWRDWPFLKLAFGGWVTATFLLLLAASLLSPLLGQVVDCSSTDQLEPENCSNWNPVLLFLQKYLSYLLVLVGVGAWILLIRKIAMPKVKLWLLAMCSPLLIFVLAELGFQFLILTVVARG